MKRTISLLLVVLLALNCFICSTAHGQAAAPAGTVQVNTTPDHVLNSFDPDDTIGSSIDVLSRSSIDSMYTPEYLQECLMAGWGPLTMRQNSELYMSAWHWSENGSWSDPVNKQGYWTSSDELKAPLRYVLTYALPHRGFAGYGIISNGAPVQVGVASYWKSNPYLSSHFTGESDALHPQWVVEAMGMDKPINAIRIDWVDPYAVTYQVQYWNGTGNPLDFYVAPQGDWKIFPNGSVTGSKGGTVTLKLADAPITARYLRVLMTESSNTPDTHGAADIRNCVGFALQSISAGTFDASGAFVPAFQPPATVPSGAAAGGRRGAATRGAPATRGAVARRGGRGRGAGGPPEPQFCTSSVDPWHSPADEVTGGGRQHTGFDLLFTSGLTNYMPALVPITMLYATPEDAANEISYLDKRGYPIRGIEMGEEPEGQRITPEDYGALYCQFAAAIRKVDTKVKLGGPVYEGVNEDVQLWPDAKGNTSWTNRFVNYLKDHGHLQDLGFFSFEHYPLERPITWESLYKEPYLMTHILVALRAAGVPKDVPLMNTESSISGSVVPEMSQLFAGIWLADSVGSFFQGGGAAYYHSPIQPGGPGWSSIVPNNDYGLMAFYWSGRMINMEWVAHRSGVHQMFPSSTDIKDAAGNVLVTSYALHRPDGNWSLMLVNRDENNAHTVHVTFEDVNHKQQFYARPIRQVSWGAAQYAWQGQYADPDDPPMGTSQPGGSDATYTLPKASVTVLRGLVH